MPGTEVKVEETMGIDKCVMQTITTQSFDEIPKNTNARSYREDHSDGVYTLVEEFLLEQGTPQFAFDGTIGTEPLETNPAFNKDGNFEIPDDIKKLWAAYKRNPSDAYLAGKGAGATSSNLSNLWMPALETNASFVVFYTFWKAGMESYYVGRVTVRVTALEEGAPDMTKLGKIDQYGEWPPGFTAPEGSNFILSGVRSQQEGEFYRTTYEYQSSPAKTAWNIHLYE
jgi:hypothetical protein